ncbi:hypothetical protein Z042_15700 [Chania multitudinisentens RB-25]|uniref:EthD domain-containing protein n=1 Tax=Chania multitudinisentens RB-25 TaxID=1441930 RepID=W0LET4_9GAMM|nr:hypothetical protein [Chania multitudinisentens]AHG20884.1 hypothetical protein Z042_15700 [Chania multitudinisentens RB-25]
MSANYLMISRYPLKKGMEPRLAELLQPSAMKNYYLSIQGENKELLEFNSYAGFNEIQHDENNLDNILDNLTELLSGDVKRELVKYVESPIASEKCFPDSEYVQLRHVEVVPEFHSQYRSWREETIFNVVRSNKDKIESFEAYHSVFSTQPGVMFVSAFSVAPEEYMKSFTDENYQKIIQQAGDKYITGGNDGLYTRIYQKI